MKFKLPFFKVKEEDGREKPGPFRLNPVLNVIPVIIGAAGIMAAWFILLGKDTGSQGYRTGDGGVIYVDGEKEDDPERADALLQEENEDTETVSVNEEKKESLNESLKKVEGLSPGTDRGYIFVGDSRFVNMNNVCDISEKENLFMVAKVGEGYSWFNDTALGQIKRIISSGLFKKWKLIICLGINDLGNLNKYINKYEALKEDYDITLVSVNPVNKYGNLTNAQIEEFNETLRKLPLPYIDTYNILLTTGYSTTDGLHYNKETTEKIYNGILLGLEENEPGTLKEESGGVLDSAALGKKKSIQSDITAQNKYVKKEPEPGSEIDEELLKELLKNLSEIEGEAPAPAENGGESRSDDVEAGQEAAGGDGGENEGDVNENGDGESEVPVNEGEGAENQGGEGTEGGENRSEGGENEGAENERPPEEEEAPQE